MRQCDAILLLLRSHPQGITTNEIITSPYSLASEYRSRISELRGKGYIIECEIKRGGQSIWTLIAEPDGVGQLCLRA